VGYLYGQFSVTGPLCFRSLVRRVIKTTKKAIKGPDFLVFMPLKTQFIWKSLNDQIKSFFEKKLTYDIEITSHHTVYFKHLGPYKQREKQTDRHTYIKYIKTEIERIHT